MTGTMRRIVGLAFVVVASIGFGAGFTLGRSTGAVKEVANTVEPGPTRTVQDEMANEREYQMLTLKLRYKEAGAFARALSTSLEACYEALGPLRKFAAKYNKEAKDFSHAELEAAGLPKSYGVPSYCD